MNFAGTLVAFVASTDLEASRRFYGEVLGLAVTSSSPYAAVFEGGGTTLRVTLVNELAPAAYTVLGWDVTDVDSSVDQLKRAGVVFTRYDELEQDDHDAWTAPDGTRVAWFNDPDANVLSLAQHA